MSKRRRRKKPRRLKVFKWLGRRRKRFFDQMSRNGEMIIVFVFMAVVVLGELAALVVVGRDLGHQRSIAGAALWNASYFETWCRLYEVRYDNQVGITKAALDVEHSRNRLDAIYASTPKGEPVPLEGRYEDPVGGFVPTYDLESEQPNPPGSVIVERYGEYHFIDPGDVRGDDRVISQDRFMEIMTGASPTEEHAGEIPEDEVEEDEEPGSPDGTVVEEDVVGEEK